MNHVERELCLTRMVTDWPAIQGAQNAYRVLEAACRRLGFGPYASLTPEEKERLKAELAPDERATLKQLRDAKNQILLRYWPAVQHYLEGRMRHDLAGAEQVCDDFTMRFLEREAVVARADPARGRFRSYLKTILYRMVVDYWRTKQREREGFVSIDGCEIDPADFRGKEPVDEAGWREVEQWHREIVRAAWETLERAEARGGPPFARVLLMKERDPEPTSAAIAEELSAERAAPVRADAVRQWVRRGRQEFAEALVAETARSLRSKSADPVGPKDVQQALEYLNLFNDFAKAALERMKEEG